MDKKKSLSLRIADMSSNCESSWQQLQIAYPVLLTLSFFHGDIYQENIRF